jgi:hypothetical protein
VYNNDSQSIPLHNREPTMNTKQALKTSIDGANMIWNGYLADLSDADLLVRPLPGANHIAWQLGHCIAAENMMVAGVKADAMPKLPEGFVEKYSKETAANDNPKDFLTKAEYLKLAAQQRAATYALLDTLSDADLDQPSPESMRSYCPTVGSIFSMQGTHWLMHAGQWAIIRRKLGKPPLY